MHSGQKVLIIPSTNADGMASGAIVATTITMLRKELGHRWERSVVVHFVKPGHTLASPEEQKAITALCDLHNISFIAVTDHGSYACPPLGGPRRRVLLIDKHETRSGYPDNALAVKDVDPLGCTTVLTWRVCSVLVYRALPFKAAWLVAVGACSTLGRVPKTIDNPAGTWRIMDLLDLVPLLNAPARTPAFNVMDAWRMLRLGVMFMPNHVPVPIRGMLEQKDDFVQRLYHSQDDLEAEIDRWIHLDPWKSKDQQVAVLTVSSRYFIQTLLAMRWSPRFSPGNKVKVVVIANDGYVDGRVDYSAIRVERRNEDIDCCKLLRGYDAYGISDSCVTGHREQTSGTVTLKEWEKFEAILGAYDRKVKRKAMRLKREVMGEPALLELEEDFEEELEESKEEPKESEEEFEEEFEEASEEEFEEESEEESEESEEPDRKVKKSTIEANFTVRPEPYHPEFEKRRVFRRV